MPKTSFGHKITFRDGKWTYRKDGSDEWCSAAASDSICLEDVTVTEPDTELNCEGI